MKKLLAVILAVLMAMSFAACGEKPAEDVSNDKVENQQVEENKEDAANAEEEDKTEENEEVDKEEKEENKSEDKKQETAKNEAKPSPSSSAKPEAKPEATEAPASTAKPEATASAKPETKPEATPTPKPETTPAPETNKSVGNILLADFKTKAKSGSALSIAEGLISNPVIAFSGGAMPVEPGYLTGFGNTEIKGFKEGAMFAPMIGTLPFVGYVFTLEDSASVSSFISELKSAADLRWNICTSADEMVTGSVGNKVFFVMCPESFEE